MESLCRVPRTLTTSPHPAQIRSAEFLATDEWRQMLEERVLPFAFGSVTPAALGDRVLEIGPGPGMTTDLLRTRVPRLTSIELDTALAAALRERLAATAVTNVEVVEGDATDMPFEDGSFSGAVTFTMLHHVPTVELQDAMFRETLRVLRPGGVLVANDSVPSDELASFHVDDIYNPIDPTTLEGKLAAIGYVDIDVETTERTWACRARKPA